MISMIVELLKNIKQAALSHALSATMVVQGVALQQVSVNDFSQQESSLNELIAQQAESVEVNNSQNFDNENYWQEIEQIAEASTARESVSTVVPIVEELYEEFVPEKTAASDNGNSEASSPLVSSNFGVTVAVAQPSSRPPSVGESNKPSLAPKVSASGGQNNISAQAVADAINATSLNREPSSSSETSPTNSPSEEASSPREITDISESSQSVSDTGPDQNGEDQEEEGQEGEEEQESFEYLGSAYLVKNGQEQVQIINDQDELVLESDAEYSILIAAETDFGSVYFNLENRDNDEVHTAQENQLPFSLNGDSGPGNDLSAYSFESASYQLDLRAYDNNGQGGEVLETRTIRFTVVFSE